MNLDLGDKVVLVTGATGGIGTSVAQTLASEGAQLALQGRTLEKVQELAQEIDSPRVKLRGSDAKRTLALAADLAEVDAAQRIVDETVAAFGRLDVLICCAGATRAGAFADLDDAAWHQNLEIKLFSTIRVVRAAVATMRAQKSGRVVLVVGNNGREPTAGMLPGAVANAGLLAFTRGLAHEIASDGVIINAVNPGPVYSDRWKRGMEAEALRTGRSVAECEAPHLAKIPLGRFATPEQVARHVTFLASNVAGHMTGGAVMVDGGAARGIG